MEQPLRMPGKILSNQIIRNTIFCVLFSTEYAKGSN